ncbi:MAG: 4-(cytidine 5'-diphospho)-2-C-methyl-D-erythritol kinase [Candidatus Gastranaerophilales bacterium]|nr:4-(cytidine 5'-diphospho)-2-C-methyl-D-erythritol kinase [Candidatus Gastranaerophilales bacterium]
MNKVKVRTPAKVNLSLEILGRLEGGYHELSSVMQTIDLYDYLTIKAEKRNAKVNTINLCGNSAEIPYNEKNIVYKAAQAFLQTASINGFDIAVEIEKHIPVSAGLAGGSTDAAGVLAGLNRIFDSILPNETLHSIAAALGSDLNFCLEGGACLLASRGEIIKEKLPFQKISFLVVKPKEFSVSTKECYEKFVALNCFSSGEKSRRVCELFKADFTPDKLASMLCNDLENAIISDYSELVQIKKNIVQQGAINSLMSGSGSAVFGILPDGIEISNNFGEKYEVFLAQSTPNGVEVI